MTAPIQIHLMLIETDDIELKYFWVFKHKLNLRELSEIEEELSLDAI